MKNYLLNRLLLSLLAIWGITTIVFFVLRVVPGDPAIIFAGPSATAEQVQAVRVDLGLNRPLYAQYFGYLGSLAQLDLGNSYRWDRPVLGLVMERLPATALLASSALVIALMLSIPLGVAAVSRRDTAVDRAVSLVSLLGQALPNFWVGILLILIFAAQLHWLPSSGIGTWKHLILPAFTLALPLIGVLARLVRAGLLEVLGEDYIRTARARGLSDRVVLVKHAGRNMLIPVVTMVGLQFAQMLGGTVVIETVFGWPGLGRLLVDSVATRDYSIVQAAIITIAVIFTTVNLLVDLSYSALDPRVRIT